VLRRYGLTFDQVERLLSEQGGRCAICHKFWAHCKPAKRARDENVFLHYLCIDHDHKRNTVRGLLCNACNTAIGLFEEEPDRFEAAVEYLRGNRAFACIPVPARDGTRLDMHPPSRECLP
jgi:hypothetical protein